MPQELTLGPILFLSYFNDFENCMHHTKKCQLFGRYFYLLQNPERSTALFYGCTMNLNPATTQLSKLSTIDRRIASWLKKSKHHYRVKQEKQFYWLKSVSKTNFVKNFKKLSAIRAHEQNARNNGLMFEFQDDDGGWWWKDAITCLEIFNNPKSWFLLGKYLLVFFECGNQIDLNSKSINQLSDFK